MPQFINVDSTELEVVNGFPGSPGSHFRLPSGKLFGFPWKPDRLYRIGQWIVGISLSVQPGRAHYSAHNIEDGGTVWNADVNENLRFSMDPDGRGFAADTAHTTFDRTIAQVLQFGGYIVAWHDRYMAVIDPATLRLVATRP